MKRISTLLFISSLLISTVSTAQFALREDFVYPAGPLVNAFNPFWKTISGTSGQIQVSGPGLSYAGYKTANPLTNKISLVAGNGEDVTGFLDINQDAVLDAKDTVSGLILNPLYYSFLINVSSITNLMDNVGDGDYFSAIIPTITSTFYTSRVYIRKGTTSGYQVGLKINSHASNPTVWATGTGDNMATGTTYLLAFRYTFNPGTKDDVANMWVNPVLNAGVIPAPNVTVANNDVSTSADINTLGGVLFRQAGNTTTGTPSMDIDAIAAGASWDDVLLPVGVHAFQASLQNNTAQLSWELPTGQGLKGFYVERSVDGSSFNNIGYVATSNSTTYSFADAQIKTGLNYYRLKMMNTDGTVKYSSVVVINNQQFVAMTLFPNPVKGNLTIAHPIAGKSAVIRILDMSGKQMLQLNLQAGATQTALSLPILAKGAYMLVLENNGQKTVSRFVKD